MKYPEEKITSVRNKLFELFEEEELNPAAMLAVLGGIISSAMAALEASETQVDLNLAIIKRGWLDGLERLKELKENE